MCLAQGPQHSDAGETWTHGPSVSSQALYHWATALPNSQCEHGQPIEKTRGMFCMCESDVARYQ